MRLTDGLDDTIIIDDQVLDLDLSFDNVLRIIELMSDDLIPDNEKIEIAFEAFVIQSDDVRLELIQKRDILQGIFDGYVQKDNLEDMYQEEPDGEDGEELPDPEENKKVYDFVIDADSIFASFMYDYGIDLVEEQGKMHWRKFIALLGGLSKESSLMQIIQIRTSKIPKPTKYNGEDRKQMQKLKRKYALPTDKAETKNNVNDTFDTMAKIFKSK